MSLTGSCQHLREGMGRTDITVHYHTGLCHAVYLSGLLGTRMVEVPAEDGPDISDLAVGCHLLGFCAGGNHASAAAWAVGDMQLCPICVPLHQDQHKEVRCSSPDDCSTCRKGCMPRFTFRGWESVSLHDSTVMAVPLSR